MCVMIPYIILYKLYYLQHSLMKMRIYTTSVISRGIYTPKVFLFVYMVCTKKPWVRFKGGPREMTFVP